MAVKEAFQSALEDLELLAGPIPHEGIAPSAFHVTDHGQRPTLWMAQHPLRQASHKRVRGDLGSLAASRRPGELIHLGRSRPIAGEVKGQQSQKAGVACDVVSREIVVLGDRPFVRPRPVLAEQSALVG